jgi:hypothetical protein
MTHFLCAFRPHLYGASSIIFDVGIRYLGDHPALRSHLVLSNSTRQGAYLLEQFWTGARTSFSPMLASYHSAVLT